jgi:hypothetical protein
MQAQVALFYKKMKFSITNWTDFTSVDFAYSTIKNNWIRGVGRTLPCTPVLKKLRLLG